MKRFLCIAMVLLAGTACIGTDEGTEPTAAGPFTVEGTLAIGDSLEAQGGAVVFTFVDVEQDSRCPTDVTCIRAGNATVRVELALGAERHRLSMVVPRLGEASQNVAGISVMILDLTPLPVSESVIDRAAYRLAVMLVRS